MSAFIVDKHHIDHIVTTANRWEMREANTPDELGRTLWTENVKSVAYRYSEPTDMTEAAEYRWPVFGRVLKPVEALKAINCLEYQSCEHPAWQTSEARRFCESFKAEAIGRLDGYSEAPWEWSKK